MTLAETLLERLKPQIDALIEAARPIILAERRFAAIPPDFQEATLIGTLMLLMDYRVAQEPNRAVVQQAYRLMLMLSAARSASVSFLESLPSSGTRH